jgi:ubiquinone biosynthesis accessory factor UbiJ
LINELLSRALNRSPGARALCLASSGKRLRIEALGVGNWDVVFSGESLSVERSNDAPVDLCLRGAPLSLLMLAGSDPQAVLQQQRIQMTGDIELAERLKPLARLLRPDIEEGLSPLLGDVGAHRVMGLARAALAFKQRLVSTGLQNLGEYALHEKQVLVSRAEASEFLTAVDQLREATDRLTARVALLSRTDS